MERHENEQSLHQDGLSIQRKPPTRQRIRTERGEAWGKLLPLHYFAVIDMPVLYPPAICCSLFR